ncbi:hypothetical protein [Lysobacter hankyongensis]|uniref:Secreted protein n=1 Tax=Lysobacter hankyongensis TaxID=1176535 RepID=A0ABP9CB99_9GAMM
MVRSAFALALCLTAMPGIATAGNPASRHEIRFPPQFVRPPAGLAIDHVRIVIACGEFVAIERIPADWNVGVSRPISAQAGFDATAGHGASALDDLSAFDGAIVVGRSDASCLRIQKATASSMQGEWEREIVDVRLVERASP